MTEHIRTALLELGDVPPPPDLAGAALTRARRDRRRRVTALVAGVAVLAAAALTVPTLAFGRTSTEPAAQQSHLIVTAYVAAGPHGMISDGDPDSKSWDPTTRRMIVPPSSYRVYDRASGRYVLGPWRTTTPSPDGRLVAVAGDVGGGYKVGIVAADRVLDPSAVRWVANGGQDASLPTAYRSPGVWSPDSSRLYLNSARGWIQEKGRWRLDIRGLVVDARTGTSSRLSLVRSQSPDESNPSNDGDPLVFGPRGAGFVVASTLAHDRAPAKGELAFYDEQGALTRTMPIGPYIAPPQPFSPDGRLVALHSYGDVYTRIVRVADGVEVGRANGAVVGWIDDEHYAVRVKESIRVIEAATGHIVTVKQVFPTGYQFADVWLARVEGPVPPGAIVVA